MEKVQKLDKLTRDFLSKTSNPLLPFDAFTDIQDPTYVSFKINFFPDLGYGILNDTYSTSGLFRRPREFDAQSLNFQDSAYDYLAKIGSPTRQAYYKTFVNLLYRLQTEAPWYFQSVSGLADIYKLDPAINFRAKDKTLTIECLESVDMRMTFLADLYRNFAFDMQYMREILPVNLRTFNMEIYVLEFRRFNTTFGVIADALATPPRSVSGEQAQKTSLADKVANTTNVLNQSNLSQGIFNNLIGVSSQLSDIIGGVNGLFGGSPIAANENLEAAFEAISVQTYVLKDCEFDFYSESPSYLDTVSVKDFNEASTKFKIKVGIIEKVATYPFFKFVLAEHIRHTMFSGAYLSNLQTPVPGGELSLAEPDIEQTPPKELPGTNNLNMGVFWDVREKVFPTDSQNPKSAQTDAYNASKIQSDILRKRPMERLLSSVTQNVTGQINQALNDVVGRLSGGILGNAPLGNVYGKPALINRIRNGIADFFSPGDQTPDRESAGRVQGEILGKILENPNAPPDFQKTDILDNPPPVLPWVKKNVYGSNPTEQNGSQNL